MYITHKTPMHGEMYTQQRTAHESVCHITIITCRPLPSHRLYLVLFSFLQLNYWEAGHCSPAGTIIRGGGGGRSRTAPRDSVQSNLRCSKCEDEATHF